VTYGQSTWSPTSGTNPWTTTGNWTSGTVPNAVGAVAVFPNSSGAISLVATTVTAGTISVPNGSTVTLGDTATTNDILTLSVASGTPLLDIANSGGRFNMYANVAGSQGFAKTGAGNLSFRFNPHTMAFTGTVSLGGGTLTLDRDGNLGSASNPLLVTANSVLSLSPANNADVVTIGSGRTMTINSGVTMTAQTTNATAVVFNNPIGGAGNLTLNATGTFTFGAANTYSGNTTITSVNRVALSSNANLSTNGTLTIASGSAVTYGTTLELGGNSQAVRGLTISCGTTAVTHTITGGTLAVTAGNATISGQTGAIGTGTATVSMAGLSAFSYANAAGTFQVNVTGSTTDRAGTILNLATAGSGSNGITAATLKVGSAPSQGTANSATLGLGTINEFNAGTFEMGGFNSSGTVAYQSSVSGGSFVLRGATGGVTRSGTVNVGWTSSGSRLGDGLLDLASGSTDARADAVVIGRHGAGANNSVLGKITMGSGTFDALSMDIGEKTNSTGTPTVSGTFAQSGGEVRVGMIRFGNITATTSAPVPIFNTTYALSSGTLRAQTITTESSVVTSQTSSAGSVRQIAWTGGTIATYDAATDLTIGGTSINAGYDMRIVLGSTSSPQVFHADVGRIITLNSTSPISGSGLLTKKGAGTVTIGSTATYTGATVIDAGRLLVNGNATAALGAVSVNAGGILGGTGSLGGAITVASGGSLAPGASIGTLTGGSTVSLLDGSAFDFEINTSSTTADLLKAAAGLALTGTVDLIVTDLGGSLALPEGTTMSLANYVGSLSGVFSRGGLSLLENDTFTVGLNNWRINYASTTQGVNVTTPLSSSAYVNIAVVPEPSSALYLMAVACSVWAWRRGRRR
jgi:fibronectin-binding autotransporter adhesin